MKLRVASGAGSALLLTATTLIVSVVLIRLIVAALSAERAGFWFLLLSFSQFILFFDLGFSPTLTRTIALAIGKQQDPSSRISIIGSAISTLQMVTYILALIIFFAGIPIGIFVIPTWLNLSTFDIPSWVIFLAGAVTNLAGGVKLASLNGLGYVSTERLLRALGQILWLLMTYAVLKLGYDLTGLAFAWALQGLIVRVLAGWILKRRHPELHHNSHSPQLSILKEMFPPSIRWAITSLGAFLILQTGNIVIAKVLGTSSIPPYEALNRMLAALMTLGVLVASASSPFISRSYGANDSVGLKRLLFLNVRIGMTIVLSAAIFLWFQGRHIVSLWLTSDQFAGDQALSFGIAMAILEVHHVILATAVMATGIVPFAGWAVGAGVLNLILGFLLVPRFGLAGMAASTFTAQLITNNWYAPFVAFRRFKISVLDYVKTALSGSLLVAAILSFVCWILTIASNDVSLMSLIIKGGIYSVCTVAATYLLVLEQDERSAVLLIVRKKLGYA